MRRNFGVSKSEKEALCDPATKCVAIRLRPLTLRRRFKTTSANVEAQTSRTRNRQLVASLVTTITDRTLFDDEDSRGIETEKSNFFLIFT